MNALKHILLPASEGEYRLVEFKTAADGVDDRGHLLSTREIRAINTAISAGRPLLVRGEPGIGKSQLARAAARALDRVFLKCAIDSHTEPRDLLWTFDAVRRLAEAQLAGALREPNEMARANLAVDKFVIPGPLWWAFNHIDAEQQCRIMGGQAPVSADGGDWQNGSVLLLDEIDKAETEVPNGLLDALGSRTFTPQGRSEPVCAQGRMPLVIITTNEDRTLPDAFLRRCFVLFLKLPAEETDFKAYLVERGRVHFGPLAPEVLSKAADMLYIDRRTARSRRLRPLPGLAEYLDLLRAVEDMAPDDAVAQGDLLDEVREYALQKHAGSDVSD
jgi:MoxR-like ATPase